MQAVYPLFYLGSINYYASLLKHSSITFEVCENYNKQTYRNRCTIYGANGKLNLVIPIKHTGKVLMKDTEIANINNWQTIHWRSIESAYRSSPYFEYFEHIFSTIYSQQFENLCDLNIKLHGCIMEVLKMDISYSLSKIYTHEYELDFRNSFDVKSTNTEAPIERYIQVFESKHGFLPNLSILDLIFNEGSSTLDYLKRII